MEGKAKSKKLQPVGSVLGVGSVIAEALMNAARYCPGEKYPASGCHGDITVCDGRFANDVRDKLVCLRLHAAAGYPDFFSSNSNQYRRMRWRYDAELHQERAQDCCNS